MESQPLCLPQDGRQSQTASLVARGTRRLLRALGLATVTELVLADGRRADIVGLGPEGSILIVEVKSSVADLRADKKWTAYRAHCDRLYFAVPTSVPLALLPEEAGIILADAHGAAILRDADVHRLAPATRRAMLIRFGQAAAARLHHLADPLAPS